MDKKENRTLERYKQVAAEMSLFHELGLKLLVNIQHVLTVAELDKLRRALDNIDTVRSCTENNMFLDFPELDRDYCYVFYGALSSPDNHVKEEQIALAKKIVIDVFELEDNKDVTESVSKESDV